MFGVSDLILLCVCFVVLLLPCINCVLFLLVSDTEFQSWTMVDGIIDDFSIERNEKSLLLALNN